MNGPRPAPTVGILYAGEMGSSLGRVLRRDGLRVVTTLEGRSARTSRLCREAGLEELASLGEVVRLADVVVSVVSPSAAVTLAREYADLASTAPTDRLYVDANAVSPSTAVAIGRVLADAGVGYVDAAINGLASHLSAGAVVYLSGSRAAEAASLFGKTLRVQVVGDAPGRASALKGALAGLSKGLAALFVEIAVMAREAGVSETFLERCRAYYPGVMEVVDRMLPTYPLHAARRAEEMAELDEAMTALGQRPDMVRAAGRVTRAIVEADLGPATGPSGWTTERIVEALQAGGTLRAEPQDLSNR
jgi:3-hydroxyisobutyrate dehydrogenase-like beta-hydroxyacid dehydrogenase